MRRSAASSSRSRASSTSRRCPSDVPEYIDVDVSGLELGESLRLEDVAPVKGVTFLDDAAETVIANCSIPRGLTEAEEAADEALAAEASAESAAEAEAAAPATRSSPCRSSVGASRPRRSTCSSSGSETRAASTSAIGTTSASWSSTSSARRHGGAFKGEVQRPHRRGPASTAAAARAPEARHVHERLRPLRAARRARSTRSRSRRCSSSTTRSTSTSAACRPASAAASPATTAFARSPGASAAPSSCGCGSGVGRPGRGDPRAVADFVLAPFAPEDDVEAIVARAADAVESLAAIGLEETQRLFN